MSNLLAFFPYSPSNYQDYLRLYKPYYLVTDKVNTSKQYRDKMSQIGFLVGDPNETNSTLMTTSPFHICAYIDNKVVGIIRADKLEVSQEHDHQTAWFPNTNKHYDNFHQGFGLELGVIMVDPKYKNRGIAKELLSKLIEFMRVENYPYLYSWVVLNPPNTPSLSFHQKQGFNKVAKYNSNQAFGIKNYQSLLFAKEL